MVLRKIEQAWDSDDPRVRYYGLLGKFLIEVGTGVAIAAVLVGFIWLIEAQTGTRQLLGDWFQSLLIVGPVAGFLGNLAFCEVINSTETSLDRALESALSELDEVDDSESD